MYYLPLPSWVSTLQLLPPSASPTNFIPSSFSSRNILVDDGVVVAAAAAALFVVAVVVDELIALIITEY